MADSQWIKIIDDLRHYYKILKAPQVMLVPCEYGLRPKNKMPVIAQGRLELLKSFQNIPSLI